ncbi:EAL domain-containing protein [Clostridium sp. YIM B02515]|uniref:EAL domain-containing protein n=1 Tax=Clostridium rhizosphaerae TaxID=2803861 RepID=A0ABS1TDR6_9CLOT|nr:EAL domain-containing protein [Clostridium rhizosphaerae]MBL4937475.1 EAL domain-containing protein [Clostridium rhizosphaerae]
MEVFVARQPILNTNKSVAYYELLFRENKENYYNEVDGDKATLDVITNSFTLIGMKNMTNGKRAFINFTEGLLLNETALLLPKDKVVIEILETVTPTARLVECCKKLKARGYQLALDDFVFKSDYEELIQLADYIKVDFLITKGEERKNIIKKVNNSNIKFLAEKVETIEDFNEAVNLGYTYFQGYFFSKPTILSAKEMPTNNLCSFELLKFLKEDTFRVDDIENVIKKNVALSYKLLKYINSATLGLMAEVKSIKQALVLMGKKELMKWIALVTIRDFSDTNSEAVMDISIVRAKFGESIAEKINFKSRASEIFIMEMFSNIDVLLNQPMEQALVDLPLADDIKAALLGEENIFKFINDLIFYYENGDFRMLSECSRRLNISEKDISELYTQALEWATNIMNE